MNIVKKVSFDLSKNEILPTYSGTVYDRGQIDSILYMKSYRRISDEEWSNMYIKLDLYKMYEMPVAKDSIKNNWYHFKKISF